MMLLRRALSSPISQTRSRLLAEQRLPTVAGYIELPSSGFQRSPPTRGFSSLLANVKALRASSLQQGPGTSTTSPLLLRTSTWEQQLRHVYVEVFDNDLDAAIKVYRRKMNKCKIEDKIREKRWYSKPSEQRKLAKHYKKLNRARRELGEKIGIVKNRIEKIKEVRKIEREEKRAKAEAAAAAAPTSQATPAASKFSWS